MNSSSLQSNFCPAQSLLIVDYGSQLTQLIAKLSRALGVYSQVVGYDAPWHEMDLSLYRGFIISGGPMSAHDTTAAALPESLLASGKPMLFICYGAQRLAHELGGTVESSLQREFGATDIRLCEENSSLFNGWPTTSTVLMSHSDHIAKLPQDTLALAYTQQGVLAAFAHRHRPWYGVQFHPEAQISQYGSLLVENFLFTICNAPKNWSISAYLTLAIEQIQQQVGDKHVLLGLSGGVDSLVSAALLERAIGKQLHCVFVDHGLMRKDEAKQVATYVREHFNFNFYQMDKRELFLNALVGISEPEAKRKVVGKLFIESFLDAAKEQMANYSIDFLAQGTIYSDVIESAHGGKSQLIKSHHNVAGLPSDLHLELVEPLRYLFKDEVRQLGLALGIERSLVFRHPFPGPGLTIRILGEVKASYISTLQHADSIMLEELRKHQVYEQVSQAFCIYAPIKSVGVKGDNRSYEDTIILRIVESEDFMTAEFARISWEVLAGIARRIVNEVAGISRVVYDITSKPPATIEWE